MFLGFLLLAVHVCLRLWVTTTVDALAYDAARQVARAEVDHHDPTAVARAAAGAEAGLRTALGRGAPRLRSVEWDLRRAHDVVVLRVVLDPPGDLLSDTVTSTVRVRVEEVR